MALAATELKPRRPVALFDAALNLLCAKPALYAFTAPGGALLIYALFAIQSAMRFGDELFGPSALVTAAWLLRSIGVAAACHFAHDVVMLQAPASMRRSWVAALRVSPQLVTGSVYCFFLNLFLTVFTGGFGLFFFGSHLIASAVLVRGLGKPLTLYQTCSSLLGTARRSSGWLRVFGLTSLLVFINLHLAVAVALALLTKIFGFDLSFLSRYCSIDNATWTLSLAAITFVLFDPLRAAVATLLLIDGRVREDGFDLIAVVDQLPKRKRKTSSAIAAALLCFAVNAWAEPTSVTRIDETAASCGVTLSEAQRQTLTDTAKTSPASLNRLADALAVLADEDDDCEEMSTQLKGALEWMASSNKAGPSADALRAKEQAKSILEQPEFRPEKEAKNTTEIEDKEKDDGWWSRFLKWLIDYLRAHQPEPAKRVLSSSDSTTSPGAMVVLMVAAGVVLAIAALVLWRVLKNDRAKALAFEVQVAEGEPIDAAAGALSRPPDSWAGLADQLALQGQFREAIRHLYLALLSHFHRQGSIDYDPTLSNWEYFSNFKGSSDFKLRFRELTNRFDFAWYGAQAVSSEAWTSFRTLAKPVLAVPQGPAAEPEAGA